MFTEKTMHSAIIGLVTLGLSLAATVAAGAPGLPGKPLPPKSPPRPIYKYYDTVQEAELLGPILTHNRIVSEENQFREQILNGFVTFRTKTTTQRGHFSKLMIDFLRLLDETPFTLRGTFMYGVETLTPDTGHTRAPGWADPVGDDRYLNHGIDVKAVNGNSISLRGPDDTLAAIISAIDALPAGWYEFGFPREAYPHGQSDSYGSWTTDLYNHFCKKRVHNKATNKMECVEFDPEFTRLNAPTGEFVLDVAKYQKLRRFMPWYTNGFLNLAHPELLKDIAQMPAAEGKALSQALKGGNKAEVVRYMMRDRATGIAIADAMVRAKQRGVVIDFYGDALDHLHIQVSGILHPLPVGPALVPNRDDLSTLQEQVKTDEGPSREIEFIEFTEKDLDAMSPEDSKYFERLPGNRVRVKDEDGNTIYEGDAQAWIKQVNEQEKRLLKDGNSVRDKGDLDLHEIPTNAEQLRNQLLNELRLNAPNILNKVRNPLSDSECPQVDASGLSRDVLDQTVNLPGSTQLSYSDFLDRVGDTQSVLCSLGYSMLDRSLIDEINNVTAEEQPQPAASLSSLVARPRSALLGINLPSGNQVVDKVVDRVVAKVMEKRDDMFRQLGLSGLAKGLNLEAFNKLGDYADIVKSVEDVLSGKAKVGPEMIDDIRKKLNIKIPEELKIPQMPDFQLPGKPKRTPLNVKKQKRWDGLNIGKRDIIAMEGFAQILMGGTEESETLRADAQSNMYVFGKDFSILDGLGEMEAGPNQVKVHLHMRIIGKDLFKPIDKHDPASLTLEGPDAFNFNKKVGYNQTFMIGPIPVAVSAGGFISLGMGFRLGLVSTQVEGSVSPNAAIGGYAEAGIGFSGFLSAGAGASITVLDFQAPVSGGAKIKFDEEGYPFLNVFIDTDCRLELLNGRVYAYAEFPVPFEIKKETMDIWNFKGPNFHHKIMSWNIDVGHQGVKSGGDLLDQTDREEAAAVEAAITLDNRKEAIEEYRKKLKDYADQAFHNVNEEANSATSHHIRDLDREALQRGSDLQTATENIKKKLAGTSN